AAWMALRVSTPSQSGTVPTSSPVAGSSTDKRRSEAAGVHSPPIKASSRKSLESFSSSIFNRPPQPACSPEQVQREASDGPRSKKDLRRPRQTEEEVNAADDRRRTDKPWRGGTE